MKEPIINETKNIDKNAKISEFEIGEDIYNLSEKEQNECESSSIKININKDSQKINNRKYLSKSDYSIFNKKQKELQKEKEKQNNIIDNGNISIKTVKNINNSNNNKNYSANNSNRAMKKNREINNMRHNTIQKKISSIDLKNEKSLDKLMYNDKIFKSIKNLGDEKEKMKILDENKDNIKIHEVKIANNSIPYPKTKKEIIQPSKNIDKTNNNLIINQIKSNSYSGRNDNNFIVEINNTTKKNINNNNINNNNNNTINNNIKENLNDENKIKVMEKINKEKKEYIKVLKENNVKKSKIIIKKENNINQNNFISDVLCSIFTAFDSKKDKKNEINMLKKENKYNKNTNHVKKNILLKKEILNPKCIDLNQRNNSFIKMSLSQNTKKEANKKKLENNNKTEIITINNNKSRGASPYSNNKSSFIKISNKNNSINRNNNQKIFNMGNIYIWKIAIPKIMLINILK